MTNELGLFGAHERHNFGDWLLSFCADSLLVESHCEWLYDFSEFGVGISKECGRYNKLADFLAKSSQPLVIHVGGETLACSPHRANGMNPGATSLSTRPIFYVLPEFVGKKRIRRLFFGVGGVHGDEVINAEEKEYLRESLSTSEWLGVRDSISKSRLEALGIQPKLTPDLVSLLPQFCDVNDTQNEKRMVFQASAAEITSHESNILRFLDAAAKQFDVVEILTAGIAPGHDSWIKYLEIQAQLRALGVNNVEVTLDLNPLSIARKIATSHLTISTSLHFRIIAMAYAVPRVSVARDKVLNYASEWDLQPLFSRDFGPRLWEQVSEALSLPLDEMEALSRELQEATLKGWTEMMTHAS